MTAQAEMAACRSQKLDALALTKACHDENAELRLQIKSLEAKLAETKLEAKKGKKKGVVSSDGKQAGPLPQGNRCYKYEVSGVDKEGPAWDKTVRHFGRTALEPIIYEKTKGKLEKFGGCTMYILKKFFKECKRLDISFMDVSEMMFFVKSFCLNNMVEE